MEKKFWTSDKILSVATLFISLMTLVVFLYQTNLMRKHQYLSVLPYLAVYNSWESESIGYKFVLKNNGVGPAILKSIKITDAKGQIYGDVIDYVRANLTKKDTFPFQYSNLYSGRLLPEREEVNIISSSDQKIESANHLHHILTADSLQITIEYESVYGERWIIGTSNNIPKKIL